jgi:hypothetical protein
MQAPSSKEMSHYPRKPASVLSKQQEWHARASTTLRLVTA